MDQTCIVNGFKSNVCAKGTRGCPIEHKSKTGPMPAIEAVKPVPKTRPEGTSGPPAAKRAKPLTGKSINAVDGFGK